MIIQKKVIVKIKVIIFNYFIFLKERIKQYIFYIIIKEMILGIYMIKFNQIIELSQ